MDLTFKTENGIFNYRVCAVILNDDKLLAMKNDKTPYFFLPGGRVSLHESAETALRREIKEELGIAPKKVKPLWLAESFFVEDADKEKFHELCIYYLVDVSETEITEQECFEGLETEHHEVFEWLPVDTLQEQYLYPLFIKDKIHSLPKHFELLTEYEY